MLKEHSNGADGGGTNSWARACDACRSAACTVYCRTDSAYLCAGCDARVHAAVSKVASRRHERVWVCEACERAPAAFLCKADAASLCAACDADIHSANPLARRHHRVPILPIPGPLYGPSSDVGPTGHGDDEESINEDDEDEAASWLLINPVKNNNHGSNQSNNNGFLFGGDQGVDEYLDLDDYNSFQDTKFNDQYNTNNNNINYINYSHQQHYSVHQKSYGGDSVVPIQGGERKDDHLHQSQTQSFHLGMEYETTSKTGYGYPASISHSVSISSMDTGVVPESTMSDVSVSHPRPPKGTIDLFSGPPVQIAPHQLTPMDREARVLRYREKKKMRKFEKTIRYASRKAYAETRPRIKGRFAKRTDVDVEVDQMFSTTLMEETGYGIVPSF